jgi:hypothetical protein
VFQKFITWLVVAIVGLVPLLGTARSALAQSDAGFPAPIAVEALAAGEVPPSATTPGSLTLDRITLPAKAGLPSRQVSTIELLYVEQGTLTVADGLGLSSALPAEKSAHLRAGSTYTAINDGTREVSFLRLSFTTSSPAASPAAAEPTTASAKAVVTSLAAFDLTALPEAPVTLFLDRATWQAGADSGDYTQTGPIGMVTESGTVAISSPSGIDGQLDKGKAVLLPAAQALRTRNDGQEDAVVLLFGVVPADGPLVTLGADVPAATTGAGGKPSGSMAAGTVLYQADADGGFEDWSHAGGWHAVSGMLVNDGSSDKPLFTAAPYQVGMPDYAVEVEMQRVREGYDFGVVVRGGEDGGYWVGGTRCNSEMWLWVWVGKAASGCSPNSSLTEKREVALGSDWHTYRVEVQGNAIRVFVDGTKVFETTDNRFLTSGLVGIWSQGAQVNIRRFTVMALSEG